MIDDPSTVNEDDFLVRVKAQVMTRDESTGGWVPLGRSGMSVVGLRRLVTIVGDDVKTEYRLQGQRIADHSVVLNCTLKKDLQYTKANPTFHHWWTDDERFGLTFQSSADARVLERSVCKAMESMLTPPSCSALDSQVTDDDVFMALSLPMAKDDTWSQSISTASTVTSSPSMPLSPVEIGTPTTVHFEPFQQVHFVTRLPRSELLLQSPDSVSSVENDINFTTNSITTTTTYERTAHSGIDDIEMVDYSYVKLAKSCLTPKHDYTYPAMENIVSAAISRPLSLPTSRYCSPGNHQVLSSCRPIDYTPPAAVLLPVRVPRSSSSRDVFRRSQLTTRQYISTSNSGSFGNVQSRCLYCHEIFIRDENRRGSCPDAPDPALRLIDRVSCLCCARAMLYHCVPPPVDDCHMTRDEEPCTCDCGSASSCCQRWTLLAVLSLVVPCLWCYLPLTACHRCARWCGCCGARHKAS